MAGRRSSKKTSIATECVRGAPGPEINHFESRISGSFSCTCHHIGGTPPPEVVSRFEIDAGRGKRKEGGGGNEGGAERQIWRR